MGHLLRCYTIFFCRKYYGNCRALPHATPELKHGADQAGPVLHIANAQAIAARQLFILHGKAHAIICNGKLQ